MNIIEHQYLQQMEQIDPNAPLESQVRQLNEAYRNLFVKVEQLQRMVYEQERTINNLP